MEGVAGGAGAAAAEGVVPRDQRHAAGARAREPEADAAGSQPGKHLLHTVRGKRPTLTVRSRDC